MRIVDDQTHNKQHNMRFGWNIKGIYYLYVYTVWTKNWSSVLLYSSSSRDKLAMANQVLLSDTQLFSYDSRRSSPYLNSRYIDGGIKKLLFKNAALKRYQITTTFFILGFEDAGAAAIHCQNAFDTKHFLLFSFLFILQVIC